MQASNSYYNEVNIPLPSKPLVIGSSDTEDEVCKKLDDYFDDIIRTYPKTVQTLLRGMYYDDISVEPVENSLEKGYQANWQVAYDGQNIQYKMVIDSRLLASPIMLRWNKIHEIGGHIGQVCQRIEQVGVGAWMEEINNGTFGKFLEQSIAPAEKLLIDALPLKAVEQDVLSLTDLNIRTLMIGEVARRKEFDLDKYIRLQHRPGDNITETDHQLFIHRSDMQASLKQWMAREEPTQAKKASLVRRDITI